MLRRRRPHDEEKGHMSMRGDERDEITGFDVAKVQKRIDAMGGLFWKPTDGDHTLRVLPPLKCMEGDFVLSQVVHYGLEDREGKMRCFACPREEEGECCVCEFSAELLMSDQKRDKRLGNDLASRIQNLCLILVRPQKTVRIWNMPSGIYTKLGKASVNARVGDFTDPLNGRDIMLQVIPVPGPFKRKYDMQLLDRCKIGVKGWRAKLPNITRALAPRVKNKILRRRLDRTYG